jgi:hypothetical protein
MERPGAQLLRAFFLWRHDVASVPPARPSTLRWAASTRIVKIVLHHLARRLLALLLLLALIAGGQSTMAMSMDMDAMQMSDMDQGCKACGAPVAAPCDIVCTAHPALDVADFRVDEPSVHEHWASRSESGASVFIRPDISPPRI